MISRYALYDTTLIEKRFGLTSGLPKGVKPRYNVNPTMDEPVIVSRDGARAIELMKWGLIASGSKDANSVFRYKTYNIPSEKILKKHSWELAVRHQRCIVPVNGFYLLADSKTNKRAHYVQSSDKTILGLAGVHSTWRDDAGIVHQTYSVITSDAPDDMNTIANRLPIVIAHDDEALWLDTRVTDINSLYSMFRSYDLVQLEVTEVGTDIYSTKIDTPQLITPRMG